MCFLSKWLKLLGYCLNPTKEAVHLTLRDERMFAILHSVPRLPDGNFLFNYTRIKPDNTPEKISETKIISMSDIAEISEISPSGFVCLHGHLVRRNSEK